MITARLKAFLNTQVMKWGIPLLPSLSLVIENRSLAVILLDLVFFSFSFFIFIFCELCVCVWGGVGWGACVHTLGGGQRTTSSARLCLPDSLLPTIWYWVSRDLPVSASILHFAAILLQEPWDYRCGYSAQHFVFTWVLGAWTQVLMCAWQTLYLLSHLSSPKLVIQMMHAFQQILTKQWLWEW